MTLHDALNGFRAGSCTGKATLEAELAQQLAGIAHKTLLQMYLDVQKAYISLDRFRCMDIMRGYGMGQNTAHFISHHWDSLLFVPKASRYLGMAFGTGRGFTQGDPTYPIIFNIVVDAVVRAVLEVVCGTQEARNGMGWTAGERNLVFYTDGGQILGISNLDSGCTDGDSGDVLKGRSSDQPGNDKGTGMHSRLHMGQVE